MSPLGWPFRRCLAYPRSASADRCGCLPRDIGSETVSTSCGARWVRRCRSLHLRHRPSAGWTYGPASSDSREPPICRVASGPGRQAASSQGAGRAGDGPLRLSEVYPARSVGCSAAFFCPWGKTKSDNLLFGAKEPDGFLSCFIRLMLGLPSLSPCRGRLQNLQFPSIGSVVEGTPLVPERDKRCMS